MGLRYRIPLPHGRRCNSHSNKPLEPDRPTLRPRVTDPFRIGGWCGDDAPTVTLGVRRTLVSTNTRTLNPVTEDGEAGQVLLPLWDYPLQPVINPPSDYCGGFCVG